MYSVLNMTEFSVNSEAKRTHILEISKFQQKSFQPLILKVTRGLERDKDKEAKERDRLKREWIEQDEVRTGEGKSFRV